MSPPLIIVNKTNKTYSALLTHSTHSTEIQPQIQLNCTFEALWIVLSWFESNVFSKLFYVWNKQIINNLRPNNTNAKVCTPKWQFQSVMWLEITLNSHIIARYIKPGEMKFRLKCNFVIHHHFSVNWKNQQNVDTIFWHNVISSGVG